MNKQRRPYMRSADTWVNLHWIVSKHATLIHQGYRSNMWLRFFSIKVKSNDNDVEKKTTLCLVAEIWNIAQTMQLSQQYNNNKKQKHRLKQSSPCLRTSSTAAMSSSLRSWLSLAICSPFSRKFWVACSTDTARTWAFLERPFFLPDGPLLLVFTRVVTCTTQEVMAY